MPEPAVTAVVLAHNRRGEVMHTVERLLALPEQLPVIVVDNASSDGTVPALRLAFPGVRVVPVGTTACL
jgi:GT2 family glycosyltransferase